MKQIIQHDSLTPFPLLDKSVDCVITDPPYDFTEEQKSFVQAEMLRVCKGDIIVFSPPENQWVFPGLTRYMFWIKPTSTKNYSKNYGRFVEMIFLYKRTPHWPTDLHWSNYTGVFHDTINKQVHPHQKPASLLGRFVTLHSKIGEIVLDPFSGSGSTLLAANDLSRQAIGFEKNPDWIKHLNAQG